MKKIWISFFLLGIFSGCYPKQELSAASLKHEWRNYFSYEHWSMASTLGIFKIIAPSTGGIYILERLRSFYYVLRFNDSGGLIQIIEAPIFGQYNDLVLDSEGIIYLAGKNNSGMACIVVLGSDGALLANIVFTDGEASGLCLGEMGEVYVGGVNSSHSHFVAMLGKQGFAGAKWGTSTNSSETNFVEPIWLTLLPDYTFGSNGKIVLDKMGNLYVGGLCDNSCILSMLQGKKDAFVTKLDENGHILWNTFLGGTEDDGFQGIALDEQRNISVLGWSYASWGNPIRKYNANPYKSNAFVACLDGNGQLLWNTFLGGDWSYGSLDLGGLAMDAQGNIYLTGNSLSWGNPLWPNDDGECYVAKVSRQGQLMWHAFLPPKRPIPPDYPFEEIYAGNIALRQGSIFIAGTCGWEAGDPWTAGDTFAFLDKITETNGKTKFRIDHQLPEK